MNGSRLHAAQGALFRGGVLLTLCIAPTQWALEVRPKFFLSPADLALALTAAVWLADICLARDWKRLLPLPPWTHLLFVALAGAAAMIAPFKLLAIKDFVQYVEYFIIGHWVFASYLSESERAGRRALAALGIVTALILGLALSQYFSSGTDALHVRGSFGNRNVLGGYLALAMPMLFAGLSGVRPLWGKLLLALLLVAGLTVNLSGAAYFAIAGAIVWMAATRGPHWFIPVVAVLIAWQTVVLQHLPRANDIVHFQSLALYNDSGTVERRYPDWQAAYSMALTHPWLGVGLGNYQKHVGQYYDNIPRQTGPSEPDIQNLYLVLAASAGWPAALAFLALFAGAMRAARKPGCASDADTLSVALAQGVTGSLAAFAFTAVWHPLLERGIGLPLVFLIAFAYHLGHAKDAHGI